MSYDVTFINGVIKSREKYLLGSKIERMADSTVQEAFRILKESGFGGEAVAEGPADTELLIRAEEESVNEFILEYAPDKRTAEFFLAEYDFHNAEALLKGRYAGVDEQKLLGPCGYYGIERLRDAVYNGNYTGLPTALTEAISKCSAWFEEGTANGFNVDCAFKAGLFERLATVARGGKLKGILAARADAANVSSALRSRDWALCEKMLVTGGKLRESHIKALCEQSFEEIAGSNFPFDVKLAAKAAGRGEPLSEFERHADNYPVALLNLTRYEMKGIEPFSLYVLRRRAEIRNVRIITVSLAAGLNSQQIKNKIRLY